MPLQPAYSRQLENTDAAQSDRLARFRNVEPETAELLGVLVRAVRAARVLELGTSNGYSTIWLAGAVEGVGGRVLTVDVDGKRIALARDNLARAGLEAELRVADAADTLAESPTGAWDVIFLDAERDAYAGYWPNLLRVLRDGGLLVVDKSSRTPTRSPHSWISFLSSRQPRAPKCRSAQVCS